MQLQLKATDSGYQDTHLIGVTPQQYTTYTPPVAHAWGGSGMIVVCVG